MLEMSKLHNSTLQSTKLTHHRLKILAEMAQSSEDHVSRLSLSLSIADGPIESNFSPELLPHEKTLQLNNSEKQLRGKTLFKEDLILFVSALLQKETPEDYSQLRSLIIAHWERGIEMLTIIKTGKSDWIEVVEECLK
ncbi:MAG: hypothetical protein QF500_04395 [Candidatus Thalassarchaeaceae archaeon]|nr:hypothetical protein [Candidatus Thalassarchaeaceae archaeon]